MRRFLLAAVAALIAASASAQTPNEETVTIRAEGVPIGTLLAELAQRYQLEKVTIQPAVQQHPVWIVLDQVPLRTALWRILDASGLDFAIAGRRVIVGDWTGPARSEGHPLRVAEAAPEGHPLGVAEDPVLVAEAEQQANLAAVDNESTILPMPPVAFVASGENITYLEPNFVPYKLRPEVRARRMAIDVAKIP